METYVRPPYFIPNCDHKKVVVNRRALYLLQQGAAPSHACLVSRYLYGDDGVFAYYYNIASQILGDSKDYSRLAGMYVFRGAEFEYMFTIVKCGKCPCCRSARQLDLVNRAQMESQLYDSPPYMFTLTYDSRHLPVDGQVHIEHVQRFLKRLRINWTRNGVAHHVRYLVCGEYGSKGGRPHYHFIMWNNPYSANEFKPWLDKALANDVFNAWGMCQPQGFDYGEAGDGAAGYVTKYVTKQSVYRLTHKARPGFHMPFIVGSTRGGGIGRPFIESRRGYYHANPAAQEFVFISKDGQLHRLVMGSYLKSVLRPSPTRQIPALVKSSYRELTDILSEYVRLGHWTWRQAYVYLQDVRPPHYPHLLPRLKVYPGNAMPSCSTANWLRMVRYDHAVGWLTNILRAYKDSQPEIDVDSYYDYLRHCPPSRPRSSSAGLEMRIRQRVADSLCRETL